MIIAVDLGSTHFKFAVFDQQGRRLGEASQKLPYTCRTNEMAELSVDEVRQTFRVGVDLVLRSAGTSRTDIRRVAITSQAQTFTVIRPDGTARGPLISWSDTRAVDEAKDLEPLLGEAFPHHAGWPSIDPTLLIAKIPWWKKLHGLADTDRVVTLPSCIALDLGASFAIDRNVAAMSGLYSIPAQKWWATALKAVDLIPQQLGEVVAVGHPLPTSRRRARYSGWRDTLEVVFAGNDHTAAAFAAKPDHQTACLTLGTAGVIYRLAGQKPGPFSVSGLWGPYPGGGFYELAVFSHACGAMDWADQFLFGNIDSARFVEFAEKAAPNPGMPYFRPELWGSSRAWTHASSKEEMARAVLEGIGFRLAALRESLLLPAQTPLIVMGGGRHLTGWLQLLADLLESPLQRSDADGLDGAAQLAGAASLRETTTPSCFSFQPRPSQSSLLRQRHRAWARPPD